MDDLLKKFSTDFIITRIIIYRLRVLDNLQIIF